MGMSQRERVTSWRCSSSSLIQFIPFSESNFRSSFDANMWKKKRGKWSEFSILPIRLFPPFFLRTEEEDGKISQKLHPDRNYDVNTQVQNKWKLCKYFLNTTYYSLLRIFTFCDATLWENLGVEYLRNFSNFSIKFNYIGKFTYLVVLSMECRQIID